jgi:hypothetical protein
MSSILIYFQSLIQSMASDSQLAAHKIADFNISETWCSGQTGIILYHNDLNTHKYMYWGS